MNTIKFIIALPFRLLLSAGWVFWWAANESSLGDFKRIWIIDGADT